VKAHQRIDDREILREMADAIEASALSCSSIGAEEKAQRMREWAAELRVEAECVDEDGYVIYHARHA
jgi:hypothetical protein